MDIILNDFIGNTHIKSAISSAFIQKRVPQAIILQGDDGLGKKTLARLIAKACVCTAKNKPCGTCPACVRANAGTHPDIRTEEGSGASSNISVATIRDIIDDAHKKPDEAELKVFLLFVKNTISQSTQNKLLKIMEEPPGSCLFIICISSANALLPTIRSRAVSFTLLPPSFEQSAKYVSEKLSIDYNEALKLAELHSGNIGSMLGGKDTAIKKAIEIAENLNHKDEDVLLAVLQPLTKDRFLCIAVFEHLMAILRDAVVLSQSKNLKTIASSRILAEKMSVSYRDIYLMRLMETCRKYIMLVKRNINMNLLVCSFCSSVRKTILK